MSWTGEDACEGWEKGQAYATSSWSNTGSFTLFTRPFDTKPNVPFFSSSCSGRWRVSPRSSPIRGRARSLLSVMTGGDTGWVERGHGCAVSKYLIRLTDAHCRIVAMHILGVRVYSRSPPYAFLPPFLLRPAAASTSRTPFCFAGYMMPCRIITALSVFASMWTSSSRGSN